MNYKLCYDNIIKRSKTRELLGYVEKHHIIPKCAGGTDDEENMCILTSREHFIAHMLLVKIYKDTDHKYKMLWAFNGMCNWKNKHQKRDYKINSHIFESLRGQYSHSQETKNKISIANKGRRCSKETKEKISATRLTRMQQGIIKSTSGTQNGMYGKRHSDEWKIEQSKRLKGKKKSNTENYSKFGKDNGNAKIIKIYNSEDELMFTCNGNFKNICDTNNLPYTPLQKSYKNNTRLFQNNASRAQAKRIGIISYEGWYAILISKLILKV